MASLLVTKFTFFSTMSLTQATDTLADDVMNRSNTTNTTTTTTTIPSSIGGNIYDFGDVNNTGTEDIFQTLRYTSTIFRLCLAIFGVMANCLTCFVLTNKKLWSPTSLLLMTLVAYDALFLLASIPLCLVDAFFELDLETFAIICGIFYPIRYMAQTGSIYTTVTLTIERYLIVLRPLKTRVFCTFGKIRRFIIVIFFFSIIFNIPRCFFYELIKSFPKVLQGNMTSLLNETTSLPSSNSSNAATPQAVFGGKQNGSVLLSSSFDEAYAESVERHTFYLWLYTRVYELYVSGVFFYLLPYALIPLLNFQLLLVIKKRRHETRQISLKRQHQRTNTKPTNKVDGLTMIVLGITFCFFICCLLPAIYNVTQIANVPAHTSVSFLLLIASDTMLCINASTDFFFYCLLGAKFRNTFLHIFCKRSECVGGKSPVTYGHSRHSDTLYHSI